MDPTDCFSTLAERSPCQARSPNIQPKFQYPNKSEEAYCQHDMDSTSSEVDNRHEPVTRLIPPKKKVNILEFIGVGNGFEPYEPLKPAFKLSKRPSCDVEAMETKKKQTKKELLGESDSGLSGDDKGNEFSDDVHFTESDSDDVISSDGDSSESGDVGVKSTNSYDVSGITDDEGTLNESEFVVLLKVNREISAVDLVDSPLDEFSDDSDNDENEKNYSVVYEINPKERSNSQLSDIGEEPLMSEDSDNDTKITLDQRDATDINPESDFERDLPNFERNPDVESCTDDLLQEKEILNQVEVLENGNDDTRNQIEVAEMEFKKVKIKLIPFEIPDSYLMSEWEPKATEENLSEVKSKVKCDLSEEVESNLPSGRWEDLDNEEDPQKKSIVGEEEIIFIDAIPSDEEETSDNEQIVEEPIIQQNAIKEFELEHERSHPFETSLKAIQESKIKDFDDPIKSATEEYFELEKTNGVVLNNEQTLGNRTNRVAKTSQVDETKIEALEPAKTSIDKTMNKTSQESENGSIDELIPEQQPEIEVSDDVLTENEETLENKINKMPENTEAAEALKPVKKLSDKTVNETRIQELDSVTDSSLESQLKFEEPEEVVQNNEKRSDNEISKVDKITEVDETQTESSKPAKESIDKAVNEGFQESESGTIYHSNSKQQLKVEQAEISENRANGVEMVEVDNSGVGALKPTGGSINRTLNKTGVLEPKDEQPIFIEPNSSSTRNVIYQSSNVNRKEKVPGKNLAAEEVTLKDYDIKHIQMERQRIIGNQAVRRKTIQNWINGSQQPDEVNEEVPVSKMVEPVHAPVIVAEKCKPSVDVDSEPCAIREMPIVKQTEAKETCNEPSSVSSNEYVSDSTAGDQETIDNTVVEEISKEPVVKEVPCNTGEVISESIIEKKSSTKIYWENLMMSSSDLTESEPEPSQIIDTPSPEPITEENVEFSDNEVCDFPEFDIEESRAIPEAKEPPHKIPVVIHKKPKAGPIKPICIEVMKPAMSGNIVEQEIQIQQMREEEFRREASLRSPVPGKLPPQPSDKPQVVGEVYRSNSSDTFSTSPIPQTNEFTAEIVIAPPTHYRDSSDSGTFDTESVVSSHLIRESKTNFANFQNDIDQGFVSPDDDKRSFDPETSSDLGDELHCISPSINHTGSYESLNSVGTSGGSSVDCSLRKNSRVVTVKPLASDDNIHKDANGAFSYLNETPVERDVRIAREREEELRREQRIRPASVTSSDSDRSFNNSSNQRIRTNNRITQKSVATSRIQQEIEQQTNRELELRSSGSIKTTSHDHTDPNVASFFQNAPKEPKVVVNGLSKPNDHFQSANVTGLNGNCTTNGSGINGRQKVNVALSVGNNVQQPINKRSSIPVMSKGGLSMHKFISSGGKLGGLKGPFGSKVPNKTEMKQSVIYEPAAIFKKPISESTDDQKPAYRKYRTAESKIQTELRQMKEREEELKRQRIRLLGLSQPNLTIIDKDDDGVSESVRTQCEVEDERSASPTPFTSIKERCMSNPNLFEDSSDQIDASKSKPKSTNARRRSLLIEQWENKIQIQSK